MKKALDHLRTADPVLAAILKRVGPYKMAVREPTFETLARSITFQQLSGKAAGTIFARLQKATGKRFTATAFLKVSEAQLKECGLSRQKIAALTDLAMHVAGRKISFAKLHGMSDEEVIETLCAVRGVGVWTAQMFLMFALGRPNVLPSGDLGVRNAIKKAYALSEMPKPSDVEEIAAKWHPYCSIASWYLWRSLETPDEWTNIIAKPERNSPRRRRSAAPAEQEPSQRE